MTRFTFFFFFIPTLTSILLFLNLIFSSDNPYHEKNSTFECGYHSFTGQNRAQFTIAFFKNALLFLIFDLEIAISFPFFVSQSNNEIHGLITIVVFFVILTCGFVYEIGKGVLENISKQYKSDIYTLYKYYT